jgi:threonine dehydrogenase-like Zn-dependent dehydrogenase
MLAMNYRGPYRVRAAQKAEPQVEHPNDAIVRVTRSCICGSDLHLYHGLVPDTRVGTTFGHEFTGVVEEIGPSVQNARSPSNRCGVSPHKDARAVMTWPRAGRSNNGPLTSRGSPRYSHPTLEKYL